MMNEVLGHGYPSRQQYEQSREVEGLKKIVADLSEGSSCVRDGRNRAEAACQRARTCNRIG